jgi:hypothetical protein
MSTWLKRVSAWALLAGCAAWPATAWSQSGGESPDASPYDDEASKPAPPAAPAPPAPTAPAAAPPPSHAPEPTPAGGLTLQEAEALAAKAKELNRQGIRLLDAGDVERALEHFLASRDVLPTTKNVANAALCLDQLGRYDEALELLEELLKQFAGGLDDDDRAAIGPMMESLRGKVAFLDVSSNVGGTVFVDGRERAKLPLRTPLRILAGSRKVRVTKNGFETLDVVVEGKLGDRVAIDAELRPLKGVGQLLVEDEEAIGAEVFVDGSKVGVVPWEGSLPPGEHFVWLEKGDRGTAPAKVVIVEGQAALLSLKSERLGAPVRLVSQPAAASIELEGTTIASGTWVGRLPLGSYRVRVSEPGYHERTVPFESAPGGQERALTIELPLDPDHPRWPKPVRGDFIIGAFGGFSGGATLGGTASEACPANCEGGAEALGLLVGARGAYRFPFGLSAELGAGYWRLTQSFDRTVVDARSDADLTLSLRDRVLLHGPFAAGGISYQLFLDEGARLHLIGRASIGALLANVSDPISGTASTSSVTADVQIQNRNETSTSVAPFLMPELGIGYSVGALSFAAGLGIGLFPTEGPALDRGRVGVSGAAARETTALDDEVAYSSFLLWVPQASVAWTL